MKQKFEELSSLFFQTGQLFSELSKDFANLESRIDYLENWNVNLQTKTDKQKTVLLNMAKCINELADT